MTNPLMDAKLYAKTSGVALAAVAALGIVMMMVDPALLSGFLEFDWTHNVLHVVLAVLALGAGFAAGGGYATTYAKAFGTVYLLLGILGFLGFTNDLLKPIGLHLELGENLVHLLLGAWGVVAGFMGTTNATGAPTTTPRRT